MRRRVLSHVVQDRALRPRRHDRIGDPLDPDARAPPPAPLISAERFEGVDLVGASELAETHEHHARLIWQGADYPYASDQRIGHRASMKSGQLAPIGVHARPVEACILELPRGFGMPEKLTTAGITLVRTVSGPVPGLRVGSTAASTTKVLRSTSPRLAWRSCTSSNRPNAICT
jgi:hypothetical protein